VHRLETAWVTGGDMLGCIRNRRWILFLEDIRCEDKKELFVYGGKR
jgi:hypothetical protein